MRYRNIVCEFCGSPATVTTLRKGNYCDREECKKMAHSKASKVYYKKNKQLALNNFNYHIQRVVSTEAVDNMNIDDIKEIAQDLGKLRFKTIKLVQGLVEKERKFNKSDDYILHKLEFENLSDEDWLKIKQKLVKDRKERREIKIKRKMANEILRNITMKNPGKFVEEAKNGARKTRDFDNCLNELRKNSELFVVKGGETKNE